MNHAQSYIDGSPLSSSGWRPASSIVASVGRIERGRVGRLNTGCRVSHISDQRVRVVSIRQLWTAATQDAIQITAISQVLQQTTGRIQLPIVENIKFLSSHKTYTAALISVSLALRQTPAYTASLPDHRYKGNNSTTEKMLKAIGTPISHIYLICPCYWSYQRQCWPTTYNIPTLRCYCYRNVTQ